jgi:hypothetical protein
MSVPAPRNAKTKTKTFLRRKKHEPKLLAA